jgi:hypothetical protein
MRKFIRAYKTFTNLKPYDSNYRLCWYSYNDKGDGIWLVLEIPTEKIKSIYNKVEIIQT